jgi:hypothetical protein
MFLGPVCFGTQDFFIRRGTDDQRTRGGHEAFGKRGYDLRFETRNSKLRTRNPELKTRNSELETRNPELGIFQLGLSLLFLNFVTFTPFFFLKSF